MSPRIERQGGRRIGRRIGLLLLALAATYGVLRIPEGDPGAPEIARGHPFAWNRDAFWSELQARFEKARAEGCASSASRIPELEHELEAIANRLETEPVAFDDPSLDKLEAAVFDLAPLAAVCEVGGYFRTVERLRQAIKRRSESWDLARPEARERLYRSLYGLRAAAEEVLLQSPADEALAISPGTDEPSASPSIDVHGIVLRSGDVLMSRGGAPTSALIARGHDRPGNFSHIALLHVDERTGVASVVEAHIEIGVAVSTADAYLGDKKRRILVLRPRADLPEIRADPRLPHEAATLALREAREHHIPYDFAMDARDHRAQFCSEVASAAYEAVGIRLWPGASSISSPGTAAWLAAFGVRHFETQEPSDLEYDPSLRVVAEWRDPDGLFEDHVDNAVVDVMLEDAEAGRTLPYDAAKLPVVRLLKAWSVLLNLCGRAGPIPEGMSATGALRNRRFALDHSAIRDRTIELAEAFRREKNYRPPYWELVRLARAAKLAAPDGRASD